MFLHSFIAFLLSSSICLLFHLYVLLNLSKSSSLLLFQSRYSYPSHFLRSSLLPFTYSTLPFSIHLSLYLLSPPLPPSPHLSFTYIHTFSLSSFPFFHSYSIPLAYFLSIHQFIFPSFPPYFSLPLTSQSYLSLPFHTSSFHPRLHLFGFGDEGPRAGRSGRDERINAKIPPCFQLSLFPSLYRVVFCPRPAAALISLNSITPLSLPVITPSHACFSFN